MVSKWVVYILLKIVCKLSESEIPISILSVSADNHSEFRVSYSFMLCVRVK